jgi:Leucine-rich repeat (LRR) protein
VVLKQAWLHGHALGRPLDTFHNLDLSLERLHGLGTALRPCTSLRSLCLCNNRLANLHGRVDLTFSLSPSWYVQLRKQVPSSWQLTWYRELPNHYPESSLSTGLLCAGLQYCTALTSLRVSGNRLTSIQTLRSLVHLR